MKEDRQAIDGIFTLVSLNLTDVRSYRLARAENQTVFWRRFLVTQSSGSRYEQGAKIPPTLGMLIAGWAEGLITEPQLAALANCYLKTVGKRSN